MNEKVHTELKIVDVGTGEWLVEIPATHPSESAEPPSYWARALCDEFGFESLEGPEDFISRLKTRYTITEKAED
ncbi:hypothetical protein [Afipia sp. DC4300-2b1]|uniref:hypothetical protein n=1 Tax=Afipia sp. DC4300-2b1 TaxID=2804672 RepID=UPI003CEE20D3